MPDAIPQVNPVEGLYVLLVVAITVFALHDPNHAHWGYLVLAGALCLPAMVATLPVLYLAGGLAWTWSNADSGGPTWPVTATYATVMALTAGLNLLLLRRYVARPAPPA
jgi:hypothetical protein